MRMKDVKYELLGLYYGGGRRRGVDAVFSAE
jgi:hypothetical protein